jgi:hypothetical protein
MVDRVTGVRLTLGVQPVDAEDHSLSETEPAQRASVSPGRVRHAEGVRCIETSEVDGLG